jgi:hypothetical protein
MMATASAAIPDGLPAWLIPAFALGVVTGIVGIPVVSDHADRVRRPSRGAPGRRIRQRARHGAVRLVTGGSPAATGSRYSPQPPPLSAAGLIPRPPRSAVRSTASWP